MQPLVGIECLEFVVTVFDHFVGVLASRITRFVFVVVVAVTSIISITAVTIGMLRLIIPVLVVTVLLPVPSHLLFLFVL